MARHRLSDRQVRNAKPQPKDKPKDYRLCDGEGLFLFVARTGGDFAGAISLLITGDEEGPSVNGTKPMLQALAAEGETFDASLVGEPTNPRLVGEMAKIGRRGSWTGHLTVKGVQGHIAYPHLADNPNHRLARMIVALTETPLDPGTLSEMMGGDPNGYLTAKNEYRVQLEGGTFIPLYPGDKMVPFAPDRPAPQFAAFSEFVLRQIGMAMGLPYEQLMKDYTKTNYSSARAALLESWRYFTARRSWLTTYWAQPVYELWFEEAVNAGLIDAPDFYNQRAFYTRAKWIGPGRGWIDPVKEAEAAQVRLATGISTLEAECAEQGLDYNDVIDQRAIEKKRLQEADLWQEPTTPPKSFGFPAQPEETAVREPA